MGIGGADGASADAQGAKVKLVLTLTPIYFFQFWAQKQYASASALKGQRVGITSTTGSLYAATLLALKQLGPVGLGCPAHAARRRCQCEQFAHGRQRGRGVVASACNI